MTVFVPNTANIASGFPVFMPRDEVIELTMSVEDALKMVVSLGVVVPEWRRGGAAVLACADRTFPVTSRPLFRLSLPFRSKS